MFRVLSGALLIPLLLHARCAGAGGNVTAVTEQNLRAAVAGGGNVTFAVDGRFTLTSPLLITNDTSLDAGDHSVVLSGGGAVRVFEVQSGATLTLRRLTIADGYTHSTGEGWGGGGIMCLGSARITECTFSNNVGADLFARGGAIFHAGTELELNRSTFIGNRSDETGGAITCISGTFGGAGGTHATNCTFYANSSRTAGGAISTSGSFTDPLVFANCTFAWNTNGAIYYLGQGGSPGPVQLKPVLFNSVIAYSVGMSNAMAIVDQGNNICSDDSSSFDNATSLSGTDPLLGAAGDYGGPTWTVPLLVGSPATDVAEGSQSPATDQRGVSRPTGPRADAGAFEGNVSTKSSVTFRFASAAYSVVEGQTTAEVDIERLGTSDGGANIGFSARAGTATDGQDFVAANVTVSFAPGEMQKSVSVSILDDSVTEGDETVLLSLEGANLEMPDAAVLTIVDNDLSALITDYSDAVIRAAAEAGGAYAFAADGTIGLTNTIDVTRPVVFDSAGHNVTIAGDGTFRLFNVEATGDLEFRQVELTGGCAKGQDGGLNASGAEGRGGAILINGGIVTLDSCRLGTNSASGGAGGPTSDPNLPTSGGMGAGGAVFVGAGILNATNTQFVNNRADGGTGGENPSGSSGGQGGDGRGAAIANTDGILNLVNNKFVRNITTGGKAGKGGDFPGDAGRCGDGLGGALYQIGGTSLIVECDFESNQATSLPNPALRSGDGGNGVGGAVCNRAGSVTIGAGAFTANTASGSTPGLRFGTAEGIAGAIANFDQMQVSDCLFRSNSAVFPTARAGAVSRGGAIGNSGNLSVNRSCFERNTSQGFLIGRLSARGGTAYGGAIYNDGFCGLTNATLVWNLALGGDNTYGALVASGAFGGGVFSKQGLFFSINNTIVGNACFWSTFASITAGNGGGICSTNGTLSILNTILATNLSGGNSDGLLSDLGHNLSSDSSCNFSSNGGWDDTAPALGPLGNYGGPTPTLPLRGGSPAIDAGAPGGAPATDQRGHDRPYGSSVDVGAFESSPPFFISGRVYGFTFAGSALVSAGAASTSTSGSGNFLLEGFSVGTRDVVPSLADYVFVPPLLSVTTGPDQFDVDFHAFRIDTLSPEAVIGGQAYLVFAGASGTRFRVLASTDLVDWVPVLTNTITANGTCDCFLPTAGRPQQFFRAVTP